MEVLQERRWTETPQGQNNEKLKTYFFSMASQILLRIGTGIHLSASSPINPRLHNTDRIAKASSEAAPCFETVLSGLRPRHLFKKEFGPPGARCIVSLKTMPLVWSNLCVAMACSLCRLLLVSRVWLRSPCRLGSDWVGKIIKTSVGVEARSAHFWPPQVRCHYIQIYQGQYE